MRSCRLAFAFLASLTLTACGSEKKPVEEAKEPAPANTLAIPVTAPMAARKRMLHDMSRQKEQARNREQQLDQIIGSGR